MPVDPPGNPRQPYVSGTWRLCVAPMMDWRDIGGFSFVRAGLRMLHERA